MADFPAEAVKCRSSLKWDIMGESLVLFVVVVVFSCSVVYSSTKMIRKEMI